ncbi:MAG: FAD-dependent thymidylate synthase, partial [Synergistaceae bacterium]|nr:FAD-dependent thymidylate synthase [Synergistaceae bacterium]
MLKVELISHTDNAAHLCGEAAAICTNSNKPESALCHALDSGHTSILEHAVFTFRIEGLSRAALAQLTRHRLASFDVQSQRYVRLPDVDDVYTDESLVFPQSIAESSFLAEARGIMGYVMNLYQRMIDEGIPKEDARYITPQAVPTSLIMTMNARELLHFFAL